jgi:hypothetical protein
MIRMHNAATAAVVACWGDTRAGCERQRVDRCDGQSGAGFEGLG